MTTLNSSIKITTTATMTGTSGLVSTAANMSNTLTEVISSAQGTMLYTDEVAVAAANKTYDLIGASALLDPFGVAVDIDRIAAFAVENTHATSWLHISGLPAAMLKGTSPVLIVPPGGQVALASSTGWPHTTDIVFTGRNSADDANADGTWKILVIGKHE